MVFETRNSNVKNINALCEPNVLLIFLGIGAFDFGEAFCLQVRLQNPVGEKNREWRVNVSNEILRKSYNFGNLYLALRIREM